MVSTKTTDTTGIRNTKKQATRTRILNCALQEFSERGFEGASVRKISGAAGVNHGLIKYHFVNKDKLWKASVDFLFSRLNQEMTEPQADRKKPRHERVRLWIHRYVRYCADYPEHARIMIQESIRDSERLKWAADKHISQRHEALLESLPVTLDTNKLPQIDIPTLIYMINAATQAPFTLAAEIRHVYGKQVTEDEFIETYADCIYDLFFRPYLNTESQ